MKKARGISNSKRGGRKEAKWKHFRALNKNGDNSGWAPPFSPRAEELGVLKLRIHGYTSI